MFLIKILSFFQSNAFCLFKNDCHLLWV